MGWLTSLFLGAVQGVTEFLPVSSSGHLALFQIVGSQSTSTTTTGAENLFFDVMLHVGTTTAIVFHYRREIAEGVQGLLGAGHVRSGFDRSNVLRVGLLAIVATLPLIPDALYFKKLIDESFESLTVVGFGFLTTAILLTLTTRMKGGQKGPNETLIRDAFLVGLAQAFAPLPGVSRSGITIAAALGLGFSRVWAVGFSLLISVPAVFGAAILELRKVDVSLLTAERVLQTISATILAGLVGYAAILWLVRVVRAGRLWYFSVYLVFLSALILGGIATRKDRPDAGNARVVDVSKSGAPPGSRVGRRTDRPSGALDRPLIPGS